MLTIKIKKNTKTAVIPQKKSKSAAGFDLWADSNKEIIIPAHGTKKVDTGIAIEIPEGYFGGIYARSGMASERNLRPANCVGVIDSDYRGPVMVAVHNDADQQRVIYPHERIAQLVIMPCPEIELMEADELSESERGEGGFGSTGTE